MANRVAKKLDMSVEDAVKSLDYLVREIEARAEKSKNGKKKRTRTQKAVDSVSEQEGMINASVSEENEYNEVTDDDYDGERESIIGIRNKLNKELEESVSKMKEFFKEHTAKVKNYNEETRMEYERLKDEQLRLRHEIESLDRQSIQMMSEDELRESTPEQRRIGKVLVDLMKKAGIKVHMDIGEMREKLSEKGVDVEYKTERRNTNNDLSEDEKKLQDDGVEFLRTKDGEIYGFAVDGEIYIDPTLLNADTPMHEYTHLWDKVMQRQNPEGWNMGKELMKTEARKVWDEVINNPAYKAIMDNEDLVASEVHARLVAAELEGRLADVMGVEDNLDGWASVGRVKSWLKRFFKGVRDLLSPYTKEEAEKMTMEEFLNAPIKDLMDERKIGNVESGVLERLFVGKDEFREPYGKDNPYNVKKLANREERDKIISKILGNEYKHGGTDVLKIGDKLFVIDHDSASGLKEDYGDNIPDARGYGIRNVYNFATLTQEELNEITRNIASDYGYSKAFIQHRLQELGIKSGDLRKLNLDVAIEDGIRNNGKLDARSRESRQTTNNNRSGVKSGADKGVRQSTSRENNGIEYSLEKSDNNNNFDKNNKDYEAEIYKGGKKHKKSRNANNGLWWNLQSAISKAQNEERTIPLRDSKGIQTGNRRRQETESVETTISTFVHRDIKAIAEKVIPFASKVIKEVKLFTAFEQEDNIGDFQGFCDTANSNGTIAYHPALFSEQDTGWLDSLNSNVFSKHGIPLDRRSWNEARSQMMLHEIIHAATAHWFYISQYKECGIENPFIVKLALNRLTELYNEVLKQHQEYKAAVYGMNSEAELLAELSNTHFRGLLQNIKIDNKTALEEADGILNILLDVSESETYSKEFKNWIHGINGVYKISEQDVYDGLEDAHVKVTRGGVSDNTEYSWVTHSTPPKSRLSYTVNASYDVPKTVRMMGESFAKRLRRLGIDANVVDSERIESEVLNGAGVIASPKNVVTGVILDDGSVLLNADALSPETTMSEFGKVWWSRIPDDLRSRGIELMKTDNGVKDIWDAVRLNSVVGMTEEKIGEEVWITIV